LPPDQPNVADQHGSSPPHAPEWWAALRRVALRILDAAEAAARDDPALRDDLARVFDLWPGGAPEPAEAAPKPDAAATTAAPLTGETLVEPEPGLAAPLVAEPATFPGPTVALTPFAPPPDPLPSLVGPREVSTTGGLSAAEARATWAAPPPFDAAGIAARCRLKAEACRWQAARRGLLDRGDDVSDGDRALASKGTQLGVRLWMTSPIKWRDRTDDAFVTVAACYEALADAVETMALADCLRDEQAAAIALLGEAQSALRAAVEGYASTRRDEDQEAVFAWLRHETDGRRVFVQFMQLDNPASPDDHDDLRRRIEALSGRLRQRAERSREVERLIKKLRYQAGKLAGEAGAGETVTAAHDSVRSIVATVNALLEAGVTPTDTRLREALASITALVPPDVPPPLARAMEAVDDYFDRLGGADEGPPNGDGRRQADDALVNAARHRVAGRRAVMLGGMPNEAVRQKLRHGLGLDDLEWLRVEHHESFEPAERAICRPGVGLVIILTRWRSHRDGPAARKLCRDRGIPLVEQPAGYNLRQIANQICKQFPEPAAPKV
jgi:hypothetical protein